MQQNMSSDELSVRKGKVRAMREQGVQPYVDRYPATHTLEEAGSITDDTTVVAVAGRVVSMRSFGKLVFGNLQNSQGKLQFALVAFQQPVLLFTVKIPVLQMDKPSGKGQYQCVNSPHQAGAIPGPGNYKRILRCIGGELIPDTGPNLESIVSWRQVSEGS